MGKFNLLAASFAGFHQIGLTGGGLAKTVGMWSQNIIALIKSIACADPIGLLLMTGMQKTKERLMRRASTLNLSHSIYGVDVHRFVLSELFSPFFTLIVDNGNQISEATHMTEIIQLKQTEKDAIRLAEMNGVVFAGRNHAPRSLPLDEQVRLERVHHATLTSMIKKGLLVKTFGSDGGYAAELPK